VSAGDAGALGVTPTPPNIHGVSVRDGSSGGQNAYKANVFLTGLPDSLDLNTPAGTYSVGNYHPSIDALNVDAVLTTIAPVPLSLELTQHIGTSQPVDFKFGPFQSSTAPDGTHSLSLNYTASRQLGSLDAEAIYGNTDDAHLFISNIPGGTEPSIHVDAAFGADQKAINIVMTQDIDHITAQYRHAGVADFAGSVDLHHVPNEIHMLIGKGSASHDNKNVEMPDFTYHASHAGLDIDAFATAAITDPLDATAAVSLMVHNIGQDVTAAIDSNTHIHVTSAPATGSFLLVAAAVIDIPNIDLHFEAGPFVNDGSLRIHLAVSQLTLGFDNFTDIGMDPGVTTGLTGDFTHFTFSEFSETTIHIEDHFKVHIDLPDPFGGVDIHLIDFGPNDFNLHNLIDHFRITSNQLGEIFSITAFEAILASCDVTINARPKPGFDSGGPTISLPGPPPSDGHSPAAWLITPNINLFGITLPDFAADVVAFFESPYGNEITPGFSCHFGP
jgi:hypothetical protein